MTGWRMFEKEGKNVKYRHGDAQRLHELGFLSHSHMQAPPSLLLLFRILSLIMNSSRRDRQWFCFILISSSIRGRGWQRKGVTAICEALHKDAAMTAALTAALTEQWNISALIPLDLHSGWHPFQRTAELCTRCALATSNWLEIVTSKQPPLLSGPVSFHFSSLWGGYWRLCPEKCDFFIPTLEWWRMCERRLGLDPSLTDEIAINMHMLTRAHTDQGWSGLMTIGRY